ncbi:MAG: DUF739 family protein [Bacilli bacterium]|nr:DUF739 family protein [Bacilli bacterium]
MKKIKYDYNKLKGRIREYYGTQENFAASINISTTSLNNKLNDKKKNNFTQDEIFYSILRLNIQPYEVAEIFFKEKVQ